MTYGLSVDKKYMNYSWRKIEKTKGNPYNEELLKEHAR